MTNLIESMTNLIKVYVTKNMTNLIKVYVAKNMTNLIKVYVAKKNSAKWPKQPKQLEGSQRL